MGSNASPGHQLLVTPVGALDCLGTAGNDLGYDDLLPHSALCTVRLLDLDMIIRLKEESNRPKDRVHLLVLRQVLLEQQREAEQERKAKRQRKKKRGKD
jgi:hypothetical protein